MASGFIFLRLIFGGTFAYAAQILAVVIASAHLTPCSYSG
jgi:hypothetical protein